MSNYKLFSMPHDNRIELKDKIASTSCEVSINELPSNASVPFVHAHKQNEEVYIVLQGDGKLYIDGEELDIKTDDVFKISPKGQRCIKAGNKGIKYICIQAKENSLTQYTSTDGIIIENAKPSWL